MPPFSVSRQIRINKMKHIIAILLVLTISVAVSGQGSGLVSIEGHRGAKGYFPENTVPSFILAIEQGADTIELDVVISSDKKVVVSHDHWFSAAFSTTPDGVRITRETERNHNIYKMTYDEVKRYDVGGVGNAGVPEQVAFKIHKPLLTEVFATIEKYTKDRGLPPVRYNIEIKSNPQGDGVFHPEIPGICRSHSQGHSGL